jgi:uncharacterized protein YnzC (UPF0291/DUF896 family)
VTSVNENTVNLSAHGWREIDKQRLDEYISHSSSKLNKQDDVIELVDNEGSDEEQESFEKLRQMFEVYADTDLEEEGPHKDFALQDSEN